MQHCFHNHHVIYPRHPIPIYFLIFLVYINTMTEDNLPEETDVQEVPPDQLRKLFSWDAPTTPLLFSRMSSQGITLENARRMLGYSQEDFDYNLSKRPHLKEAYEIGPLFANYQVASKVYEQALKGSIPAASLWLKNRAKEQWGDELKITHTVDLKSIITEARNRAALAYEEPQS